MTDKKTGYGWVEVDGTRAWGPFATKRGAKIAASRNAKSRDVRIVGFVDYGGWSHIEWYTIPESKDVR